MGIDKIDKNEANFSFLDGFLKVYILMSDGLVKVQIPIL